MHNDIGGILADDMGMGKTIQVAVFLRALYYSDILREKNCHVSLIVAPVSLLENWSKELEKW
jgi:SNF2 family DNA or RNA helicase